MSDHPIPPQDMDARRLAETRSRLAEEARRHERDRPAIDAPGRDDAPRGGGDIVREGSERADSVAQTGKPIP